MLTVLLRSITPFPPLGSSSSATQSDLWLLRSHPDGLMPHPKPPREPSGSSEATQSFLCFLRSTHRPLSDSCEATQTLFWLLRSHPDGRLTHPKRDRPSSASSKASNNRRLSIACSSSHIRTRCRPLTLPTSPRTSYVSSQATQSDLLLPLSHPERPLAAPKPPRRSYDSSEAS